MSNYTHKQQLKTAKSVQQFLTSALEDVNDAIQHPDSELLNSVHSALVLLLQKVEAHTHLSAEAIYEDVAQEVYCGDV